jgi:hypothetical protein
MNEYEMREIGELQWFLGIRILRDRVERKLWLYQDSYISKITSKFSLQNETARTLMATELLKPYEGQATLLQMKLYVEKVGPCNYPASYIYNV